MPTSPFADSSVSTWLERLKAGRHAAATELHRRCFDRLVAIARDKLGPTALRWADEEDVALSVFDSFCAGAPHGRFPRLDDRNDLWAILITLTGNKVYRYRRRHYAKKRGGGRVRGDSALDLAASTSGARKITASATPVPPDVTAMIADDIQKLLDALGDETLKQIAVWKLEGFQEQEIAEKLGVVPRTVERKLARIRALWKKDMIR